MKGAEKAGDCETVCLALTLTLPDEQEVDN